MDQEDLDFIVDDGYNYDEDPSYGSNDEDEDDNDDDVSLSEYDEDEDDNDDDVSLNENDDDYDGANVSGNEDLDYVTVNLPLPFIFDEAWFEKFQIMNLIKSGLKK